MVDISLRTPVPRADADPAGPSLHGLRLHATASIVAQALLPSPDAASVPPSPLPIDFQPLDWSTVTSAGRFFERQELGWATLAPLDIAREVGFALQRAASSFFGDTAVSFAVACTVLALFGLLFATLAIVDRRIVSVTNDGAGAEPLLAAFAPAIVPGAVAASLLLSERLLGTSSVMLGLGMLALLFAGARLLPLPVRLLPAEAFAEVGASHAARLRRRIVYPGRIVLALSALVVAAKSVAMAPAVGDLFTLIRNTALMLAVVAALSARSDLMAVFPATGNPRYLAVRALIQRMLVVLLAASLLLLLLWNLGFRRAAETLLLRSYAVLAVVLVGALAARWLGDKDANRQAARHPVLEVVVGPTDWVVRLVVFGALAWALLATLGLWSPLSAILAQPFLWVGTGGVSVLGLAKGIAVLVLAAYVSRTIRAAMEVWWFAALEVPAGTQNAVSTGAHYLTMLIAGAGALTLSGVDLRGLAVFAGAAGLGIGLGLREVAAQTISGMTLLFSGTLGRGDGVTLPSGQFGRVVEVGLRRTLFETPDGSEISVPSSDLVNGQIVVWTRRSPYVRVRAEVTLPVETDMAAAQTALTHATSAVQHAQATQPAKVWLKQSLPAGQVWEAMAWVDITKATPEEASAGLLRACLGSLTAHGLQLARPTLAVTQG